MGMDREKKLEELLIRDQKTMRTLNRSVLSQHRKHQSASASAVAR